MKSHPKEEHGPPMALKATTQALPALEHYRCYTVNVNSTKADRIADTLEWFPHYVTMPTTNNLDLLIATTQDILKALHQPPYNSPLGPLTDSQKEVLQQFAEIFHSQATQQSAAPKPTDAPLRVTFSDNEEPPASVLRVPPQEHKATTPNPNKNKSTPASLLRVRGSGAVNRP